MLAVLRGLIGVSRTDLEGFSPQRTVRAVTFGSMLLIRRAAYPTRRRTTARAWPRTARGTGWLLSTQEQGSTWAIRLIASRISGSTSMSGPPSSR